MARKRRKTRVSAAGYNKLMGRLAGLRRRGKRGAWKRAAIKASAYRKRLIAANPRHPPQVMGARQACDMMSPQSRALYQKLVKTRSGQKVARLFKAFWKLPCPPTVKLMEGGPRGKTVPISGMGYSKVAHLSTKDRGQHGGKKTVIRGHWTVATEETGRHVLMLSSRPISGKWKAVGFAPETHYIPYDDLERAGTHKKGLEWRHRHGVDDMKKGIPKTKLHWPVVYADRGGKVDSASNFLYGKTPTAKISDWMYGN